MAAHIDRNTQMPRNEFVGTLVATNVGFFSSVAFSTVLIFISDHRTSVVDYWARTCLSRSIRNEGPTVKIFTNMKHRAICAGRYLLLSSLLPPLVIATTFCQVAPGVTGGGGDSGQGAVAVVIGDSVLPLNGPWRFAIGDDRRWADPNWDDSGWQGVDLTPPPGAHDADVGLSGYVPGWEAHGHSGYFGYAWYRLHLSLSDSSRHLQGDGLALLGPAAVDSADQVFVNGQLLGGEGDFSSAIPTALSIQPRVFLIPKSLVDVHSPIVVAFRVWMGPWAADGADGGGIHIAPALGEQSEVVAHYKLQWLETFDGYAVEVVESALFIGLAVMTSILLLFDSQDRALFWLIAALLLTALVRTNQAVFFWGQFETIQVFELVTVVLLTPATLGAWVLAWRSWYQVWKPRWLATAIMLATALYTALQFLGCSWFYRVFPKWFGRVDELFGSATRLFLMALLFFIIWRGIRQQGKGAWTTLPAVVLISIGLFAQELSALHIPGIWFPFGTGVSRTQFAYAGFDFALFLVLWRRLRFFAQMQGI
jgi:hypothetical protein